MSAAKVSERQWATLRALYAQPAEWLAVTEATATALERKGLAELRRTPQGWAECRITTDGATRAQGLR